MSNTALSQILQMQQLLLTGLNLLLRQSLDHPMPEMRRAVIEAWSESSSEFLARLNKQPPSVFDTPLDDRGVKLQHLGELLQAEEERIRNQQIRPDADHSQS